jgi:NDP-sugar pyrophosphorylase family protein
VWINGGFFVLRNDVFDTFARVRISSTSPSRRLMQDRNVLAQRHDGFWARWTP